MNTLPNNLHANCGCIHLFFHLQKGIWRLRFYSTKLTSSFLFCNMLIRAKYCTVNGTADLRDLVVANSTFLSQEPSCCLPRNQSVSSLTVRYANKPSHLAIWATHGKTDLSHRFVTELKKLCRPYTCENNPTNKIKDLSSC